MEENIKLNRMYFLKNADESLEGLEFVGFKLLKVDEQWLENWLEKGEVNWLKPFSRTSNKPHWLIFCKSYIGYESGHDYRLNFIKIFTTAIHIFSNTNIYITKTRLSRRENNRLVEPFRKNFNEIYGFYNSNIKNYSAEEKEELLSFLNHYDFKSFNEPLKSAIDLFYLCLQNNDKNLRFILLISILEILFIPDGVTNELGYRASRNAAVFFRRIA